MDEYKIVPDPDAHGLTQNMLGVDQTGTQREVAIVNEYPLTLYLNAQEIVTLMTICERPDWLAVGYLVNQNMLQTADQISEIAYDSDLGVIVVRTHDDTDFEKKLQRRIQTSGCAQGTMFADLIDSMEDAQLAQDVRVRTSWLYQLSKKINALPSLYLKAGAIHGCVLAYQDKPIIYVEDVGRHNAVDKIAGYMLLNKVPAQDKIFYTTGRLTSEMVIKTVKMGIAILVSRSGFTAWAVELARRAGLTLIGRVRGKRFLVLSGAERLIFDSDPETVGEEAERFHRKGSRRDKN